ncbi:MAG: iron ABC transporter permease, partial [Firmicutes bacterium]|nr:iron ABC transporter permease [Bacillota bacterium]
KLPVSDILRAIFLKEGDVQTLDIIWTIRLPRIIMAALLGGALALAGFMLQTFFENPIAGPYVLGISSGSKMVVALTMIVSAKYIQSFSSWAMILAAFAGALLSTGFILIVARKVKSMAALLVAGIMIGYICNAITDFLINIASDSDIVNLQNWSLGSFSGMTWGNVRLALVIIGITSILTMCLAKPIGALQLGESYAQSVGVNIKAFRVLLILLSSLLAGAVTAFAGPIAFVGIAVPFIAKGALGTSKPIVVIPGSFLCGSVFCMMCDLIARTAFAPVELSISTVTSAFGAPIVIYMMIRKRSWL